MAAKQQDASRKQAEEDKMRARFRQLDGIQSQKSAIMDASFGPAVYLSAKAVPQ
jgi:hypothetical protein